MAGNDITKQLKVNFLPENLVGQATDNTLLKFRSAETGESTYQTALKKSLDIENRRSSYSRPEPSSTRETYRPEENRSRAEEPERFNRERAPETTRRTSRPEPERTAPEEETIPSSRSAADEPTSTPSRRSEVADSRSNSTTGEPNLAAPVTSGQENTSTSPSPGNTTGTEPELNLDGVELSESLDESLETLNQAFALLLENGVSSDDFDKPPASFAGDFLQQIKGTLAESNGPVVHPLFETNSDGQLNVPGKLILNLISNQFGATPTGTSDAPPVDPAELASKIQELVNELVNPLNGEGPGQSNHKPDKPGQELAAQILETLNNLVLPQTGSQPDSEQENEGSNPQGNLLPETTPESTEPINTRNLSTASEPLILGLQPQQTDESTESQQSGTIPPVETPSNLEVNAPQANVPQPDQVPEHEEVEASASSEGETLDETGNSVSSNLNLPGVNQTPADASVEGEETSPEQQQPTGKIERQSSVSPAQHKQEANEQSSESESSKPVDQNRPAVAAKGETKGTDSAILPGETALKTPAAERAVTKSDPVPAVNGVEAGSSSRTGGAERTAARPSVGTTTLPATNSTEFLERLSESVRIADKNHQQLKVRLTPPQLGSMNIEVTRQDGVVTARLEVQSSTTQQVILEQLAGLKETLQHQGHTVERIEVTVQDPNRNEQSQQQGSQRDQEQDAKKEHRQQQHQQESWQEEQTEEEGNQRKPVKASLSMENIDVEI
ncbi:MAG: flagellar hook-length control protein FliK [Planctomycetaceae bacterium]